MVFRLVGFEHDLYKFGGSGLSSYSDMNGYVIFLLPYLLIKAYWILWDMYYLSPRFSLLEALKPVKTFKIRNETAVYKIYAKFLL
jgi:hypothetical protein